VEEENHITTYISSKIFTVSGIDDELLRKEKGVSEI
jgi:hypothetical protein